MANQVIEIEDETKLYSFNNIQLSIIGTYEEPWFVGEEVCNLLGYSNTKKALQQHIQDCEKISVKELREKIQESRGPTLGPLSNLKKLNWQKVLISEFGLYELIFNSHMPIARDFKDWVKTVLKGIRLKGKYELQKQLTEAESKLVESKREVESKSEEIVELNHRRFLREDVHIKLTDRIIRLGHLTLEQKNYLYRQRDIVINHCECKTYHPNRPLVKTKIMGLSVKMSALYRKIHRKNPDITQKKRTNLYTVDFYEDFGDKMINDFFEKDPINNWEINWEWEVNEQAPEFNEATLE